MLFRRVRAGRGEGVGHGERQREVPRTPGGARAGRSGRGGPCARPRRPDRDDRRSSYIRRTRARAIRSASQPRPVARAGRAPPWPRRPGRWPSARGEGAIRVLNPVRRHVGQEAANSKLSRGWPAAIRSWFTSRLGSPSWRGPDVAADADRSATVKILEDRHAVLHLKSDRSRPATGLRVPHQPEIGRAVTRLAAHPSLRSVARSDRPSQRVEAAGSRRQARRLASSCAGLCPGQLVGDQSRSVRTGLIGVHVLVLVAQVVCSFRRTLLGKRFGVPGRMLPWQAIAAGGWHHLPDGGQDAVRSSGHGTRTRVVPGYDEEQCGESLSAPSPSFHGIPREAERIINLTGLRVMPVDPRRKSGRPAKISIALERLYPVNIRQEGGAVPVLWISDPLTLIMRGVMTDPRHVCQATSTIAESGTDWAARGHHHADFSGWELARTSPLVRRHRSGGRGGDRLVRYRWPPVGPVDLAERQQCAGVRLRRRRRADHRLRDAPLGPEEVPGRPDRPGQALDEAHIWLGLLCLPLLVLHSGFRWWNLALSGVLMARLLRRDRQRDLGPGAPADPADDHARRDPRRDDPLPDRLRPPPAPGEARRIVRVTCGTGRPGRVTQSDRSAGERGGPDVPGHRRGPDRGAGAGKGLPDPDPGDDGVGVRAFAVFFEQHIVPFFEAKSVSRMPLGSSKRSAAMFRESRPGSTRPHGVVDTLESLCDQRRQFDRQARLHSWLHGWLCVHLPLSVALLVP